MSSLSAFTILKNNPKTCYLALGDQTFACNCITDLKRFRKEQVHEGVQRIRGQSRNNVLSTFNMVQKNVQFTMHSKGTVHPSDQILTNILKHNLTGDSDVFNLFFFKLHIYHEQRL